MGKNKEDKKIESIPHRSGIELDEKSLEEFNNVWKEIDDCISFVYENGENV